MDDVAEAAARPGDDVLERAVEELPLAIEKLRRRMRSAVDSQTLNLNQVGTLVALEERGWATPAELARAESMRPQSMAEILKVLEESGLAVRRAHPTDGRQIQFAVTDEGSKVRHERRIAKRRWLLEAITGLPPEEQQRLVDAVPVIKHLSGS